MENNKFNDYVMSSITDNLKSFAERCLKYIINNKLPIDEDALSSYVNCDVLSRFYKARSGNESNALAMWIQWVDWRLKYKPDSIKEIEIKNELKTGKAFLHGYDKEGRPCIVVKNCKHIPSETDMEEFVKFFIYLIESACKKSDE